MKPDPAWRAVRRTAAGSGATGSGPRLFAALCGVGILAGLWATNPSADHYQRYLEQQLALLASSIDPGIQGEERRRLEALLTTKGRRLMGAVVRNHTRRYTLGIASFYVSDLSDIHLTTLGLATFLVPFSGHDHGIVALGRLLFQT